MRHGKSSFFLLALGPFYLFLPSDTTRTDRAKLIIIGTITATFFLFTAKVFMPGGAEQFIDYANAIVHGSILGPSTNASQRDAGYPLLIIFSGYPFMHSLIPLLIIQAAFAVALPLLVFESLHRVAPVPAFYTSLYSMLTLSPYLFMKMIHHDQSYIFFEMLMLVMILLSVQTKQIRYLYLFTLVAIFTSIVRPAGNALFPIAIVGIYMAIRGKIRHYFTCAILFVIAFGVYSWHRYVIFDAKDLGSMQSYTGSQMFYDPYVNALDYGIRLSPETIGPSFTLVLKNLQMALDNSNEAEFIQKSYVGGDRLAAAFARTNMLPFTAEQLIDRVIESPNYEYYSLLWAANNDDRVMRQAAWEMAWANPTLILRYTTRNLFHFVFKPGYDHSRYTLNPFGPEQLSFLPSVDVLAPDALASLMPRAVRELRVTNTLRRPFFVRVIYGRLEELWLSLYRTYVALLSGFMCVAWATALFSAGRYVVIRWSKPADTALQQGKYIFFPEGLITSILMASLLFSYDTVLTALFVEPDFRYRQMADLQATLIAGLGLISIQHWLKVSVGARLSLSDLIPLERVAYVLRRWDPWRDLTATQLGVWTAGLVIGSFAGWALFMLEHTSV
jgi:hypothetical protein